MRALLALGLSFAACSSPAATGPAAPTAPTTPTAPVTSPELSKALTAVAWIAGDWKGEDGTEHWIAAGGAIYGVALQSRDRFEVMVIDDGEVVGPADGVLRLIAMPGGTKSVEFRASTLTVDSARFDNPAHDAPKAITYARTAEGLVATLDADANRKITFAFSRTTREAAPELEAADRARDGAHSPVASGRSGEIGFTVGKAADMTYAAIWKLQPDGTWKVEFETSRVINS